MKESRENGNNQEFTEILGDQKEKMLWVQAFENNLFSPAPLF